MMYIITTRAKIFMRQTDTGETQRIALAPGGPRKVPAWLADDPGYKNGLKDGSIKDVTPGRIIEEEPVAAEEAVVEQVETPSPNRRKPKGLVKANVEQQ